MEQMLLVDPSTFGIQTTMASADNGQSFVRTGGGSCRAPNGAGYYAVGGSTTPTGAMQNRLCLYTYATNTWSIVTTVPVEFTDLTLLQLGMLDENTLILTARQVYAYYNISANTWVVEPTINTVGFRSIGLSIHNYRGGIYRVGNMQAVGNSVVVQLNSRTNVFTKLLDLGLDFTSYPATVLIGRRIYIFATNSASAAAEWGYYDIPSNKYTRLGAFTQGNAWIKPVVVGTKVYLFGGGTGFNKVFEFDLVYNKMRERVALMRPVYDAAIMVYNGKAMLWGGQGNGSFYTDFLTYDLDMPGGYYNPS